MRKYIAHDFLYYFSISIVVAIVFLFWTISLKGFFRVAMRSLYTVGVLVSCLISNFYAQIFVFLYLYDKRVRRSIEIRRRSALHALGQAGRCQGLVGRLERTHEKRRLCLPEVAHRARDGSRLRLFGSKSISWGLLKNLGGRALRGNGGSRLRFQGYASELLSIV